MVDEISTSFKRAQERYADGELVLLIDGSGGMPHAFKGEGNPFVIAVEYATEARALSPDRVTALVFGEDADNLPPPLPLDGRDPMSFFPGGPSYFLPAFQYFVKACNNGLIKSPAHLVIVSDGDIYESMPESRAATTTMLTNFLRSHPEVMFDVIIPGQEQSGLADMIKEIAQAVPENAPRLSVVENVGGLRKSIANVINERSNAVENFTETLRSGADKPVSAMTMSALRLRKPETT